MTKRRKGWHRKRRRIGYWAQLKVSLGHVYRGQFAAMWTGEASPIMQALAEHGDDQEQDLIPQRPASQKGHTMGNRDTRTLGDDMKELQELWRNLLGKFPRWVRAVLRWLAGDRR